MPFVILPLLFGVRLGSIEKQKAKISEDPHQQTLRPL
jgi:hypothetical protein